MVGFELLPRKAFELTLADGTKVEGRFGTWSLARFGEKRKMGLEQLATIFDGAPVMDMLDFVVCAIECVDRENKRPLSMDAVQLGKFIDECEESGALLKIFMHAGREKDANEEKKTAESP